MAPLRKAETKIFNKEIISKGYGFYTPQDGSVCKIKIISDEKQIISSLNDNNEKEMVVGDVDEPVDKILEDCIRTMKEEEECILKFVHPCLIEGILTVEDPSSKSTVDSLKSAEPESETNKQNSPDTSSKSTVDTSKSAELENETIKQNSPEQSSETNESENKLNSDGAIENKKETAETVELDKNQEDCADLNKEIESNLVEIQFQLLSYTREPEIWEMSITEKWRRASYHKQRGLELYSRGAYQYAFRRFGLTLKYVISLEHDIPSGQEEGMDIKGLKLSCYLNVAACQMRHHNYESVVINSTKALAMQPNNPKALYRRGSAHLQQQEFEKAKEDLDKAQQLEPKNQAIAKQQQLLKIQVQKLNQYYASAMKKLFS